MPSRTGRKLKGESQCPSTWRGLRCGKEAGHFGRHSTRIGEGPQRVAWRDPPPANIG